ncbi:hypothetical protein L7F22_034603 [Adiantum nelumboides]|nr:hypothetical protein [Adiantum nelumboides]
MVSSTSAEMAKSTAMVSSIKGKEKAIIGSVDSFNDVNPWLYKEFPLAKQVQLKEYLQADDMYSDMQRLAALYTEVRNSIRDGLSQLKSARTAWDHNLQCLLDFSTSSSTLSHKPLTLEYQEKNIKNMIHVIRFLKRMLLTENDISINYFELMHDPPTLLYAMRLEEAELPRFHPALYPPHTEPADQLTYIQIVEQIGDWWEKAEGLWKEWIIVINEVEQKKIVKEFRIVVGEFKIGMWFWKCHMQKSEFFLQEIQYLCHIISKSGIRMDPSKLEVIKEWLNPRNLHELRSFIGMCAYYRRFIEKFSLIAGPLHDLTKKNVKYVWTERKQEAFDKLKQKIISQPVLVLPDLSKPFEVQCDACGDCFGAVLLQEGHAIAYESRRLSSDEQILGIFEKELLAVLHALDSWKHYLLETPFILRTDHQSLKYFMALTKLSNKQMRWANFLSRFNFHIAHIADKHNQVADALSRWPKVNAVSIAIHNDLSSMIDEYAIDPDFKDVISAIALGKKEEPFTLEDGYLLHGNRLCITHSLCEKVMYKSHAPPYAGHRGIQSTLRAIEINFYWPTMKRDIPDYVSKCVVCQKTKFDRGKQPGLLQPLPILDSPWESISMDFIFGLPKSIHGNTRIWTIVDRFSKQAHFIPVKKTIKAHQMATLFISQIFKYHGLPSSIVSDRDPRMISNFWKGLFENLGTRLNFSSAYHPQTDGQSEITNLRFLIY